MNRIISFLLVAGAFMGTTAQAQVKIGNNPQVIGNSSLLELEASNKALVLTRVNSTDSIAAPVQGMIIYDNTAKCLKVYGATGWSDCITANSSTVLANCNSSTINGNFRQGTALSGASYKVTLTNNSFSNVSISFATSDLVLSGVGGITVSSVSPATLNLNSGQSQEVTYTLTGTPTTAGDLTAEWTKVSLKCIKSRNVLSATSNGTSIISIASCDTQNGILTVGTAATNVSQTLSINVTKLGTYSLSAVANGVTFAASGTFTALGQQDLVLTASGTPSTAGSNPYILNVNTNCSFSRMASVACNGYTNQSSVSVNMNGVPVTVILSGSGSADSLQRTQCGLTASGMVSLTANNTVTYTFSKGINRLVFSGFECQGSESNEGFEFTAETSDETGNISQIITVNGCDSFEAINDIIRNTKTATSDARAFEAEIKADTGFITSLTVKRVGGSGGNTHKVTFCTTNSVQP